MTRDEVILEIEHIDSADDHAVEQLGARLRSWASGRRRRSLATDVEQALTCLIMLEWPALFILCKNARKSIKLSWRLVALVFVLGFFLILDIAILFVLYSRFFDEAYASVAVMFTMLFELAVFMWWADRYRRRHWVNDLGMHGTCASCRASLANQDSVIGDALWVGPEFCPKCNHKYPAVH